MQKRRRTYSDSLAECKAETEYLRTARKGGGHRGKTADLNFTVLLLYLAQRFNVDVDVDEHT